jgi:2-C-methyl-D-erythritol 4-phosphate cytidylyltransferase/2-C-methyl-D-erythritol 2,4-cyclodiphosphate synthase
VEEIVLVVAPEDVEQARRVCLRPGGPKTEKVVGGGSDRQASVRNALAEVDANADLVLVHDGARPLATAALFRRCIEAAAAHGAAVAAVPCSDTVKEVDGEGRVLATLDRSRLWLVQTPQVFRHSLLVQAHEAAVREGVTGTDDASLVERLGYVVRVVLGDPRNIKITWPEDITWAARFLEHKQGSPRRETEIRSGIGFDAHPFAGGRALVLGGVRIPAEQGLLGHSDADVLCHAISDALLGAIAAGDIGQLFPASDPQYAGVSSLSLLARVAQMVGEAGWEVENVDAVVIADAPPLAQHIPAMQRALAGAMQMGVARVSVKAKRTEGMGFTGRKEGIASLAVCALRRAQSAEKTCEENRCS